MTKRANEGFTLVELLVSILAASIVTLAACTVLLLGVRINAQSTGVITRQNTARVFMTALENMAAEGVIFGTETYEGNWKVLDEEGNAVLSYNKDEGEISAKSGVLLKNVDSSTVTMEDSGLLTCTLETKDGKYELSVYCRTVDTAKTEARNAARNAYLQKLVSQFLPMDEPNKGQIVGTDMYYSQMFGAGWTDEAHWCTHFVYWGLTQIGDSAPAIKKDAFAYINDLLPFFEGNSEGHSWKGADENYIPVPGDLVFFGGLDADNKADPKHVGAVISVAGGYVYTIEGNVEAEINEEIIGVVQLKKYELSDETILGYGVLNWDGIS